MFQCIGIVCITIDFYVTVVAPLFGAVLFGLFCGAVVPLLPLLFAVDILPLYCCFLSTPGISGRTIDVIIVLDCVYVNPVHSWDPDAILLCFSPVCYCCL